MAGIKARLRILGSTAAIAVLIAVPAHTHAQGDPTDPNAEANAAKAKLEAETGLVNARAALINAEAARDRSRIESLNLPSFEGSTTLGDGVGAMEATMLTSHAVNAAADEIRDRVSGAGRRNGETGSPPIIVLAGDETLDFSRISAIATEIAAIDQLFDRVLADETRARLAAEARSRGGTRRVASQGEAGGFSVTTAVSAISALAGLLRSNTDVTAIDLPVLSNRVLANAVAARLPDAIVPSATIGPIDTNTGLVADLIALGDRRGSVQRARDAVPVADPSKPTEAEKARLAPLTAALARFDAFAARVTAADANGIVPIVQADRLSVIWRETPRPLVLRVYVDKAGGSLINRTNLLTTLGVSHPIRVSGGMLASFLLTEPATGRVVRAGNITCRTTVSRLSWVQRGQWGNNSRRQAEGAVCSPQAPSSPASGRVTAR